MKVHLLLPLVLLAACAASAEPTTTSVETSTTAAAAPTTTAPAASTTGATSAGAGATVSASDFTFAPSTVTIKVGESVIWNLVEGAHTSTSGTPPDGDGLWGATLDGNNPFAFTFDEPGEYPYFCRFHQDFMTGTVIVEP